MLVIYRTPVSWTLLAIPLLLILTLILSIGVGMTFASLNVFYRDFTYILPFVIQIWMYASPLAYSASIIPAGWNWVYDLNPLVGIINGFRWAVFHTGDFPAAALLYSVGFSVIVFAISLALFHRLERSFADVI
jgi:lipopolysaccharide transport system permease protein